MDVVVDQMKAAVDTLTETEVQRAKAQMKAGLLMALESCGARAEQLARHILMFGRPLTNHEMVARIDNVTLDSTRAAAQSLLARSRPAVVALGAGRGLSKAVKFAEGLTEAPDRARYH
jgi:predicted Zn-dependent peptidase